MPKKLAVKKLTASDLTLFKWHFVNRPAGKQKAINMDARVLVGTHFPGLPQATGIDPRVPLDLSIYGPGMAGRHNLQRKILKQQKNWRLDGEYINNPDDRPERYNILREGDFAVFDFVGTDVPKSANMVLVAHGDPADVAAHAALCVKFGGDSMLATDESELEKVLEGANIPEDHPLWDLVSTAVLEDAVQCGPQGIERLFKRRRSRGISLSEFQESKRNAEATGRNGEEMVRNHLEHLKASGEIEDYKWVAEENAISPYDFVILSQNAPVRFLDAKSTSGDFENPIHLSMNEVVTMARETTPYDIYRVYQLSDQGGKLRVAKDLKPFAVKILEAIASLQQGVTTDSFSVTPAILPFGPEILVSNDIPSDA